MSRIARAWRRMHRINVRGIHAVRTRVHTRIVRVRHPHSVKIVDVSNNNGAVDFHAVKKAGAVGVWLKVSEGTTFIDDTYLKNRTAAKAAGLKVGGYHFCHPGSPEATQVAFFVKHLVLEPGDLLPALDFEVGDGQSNSDLRAWISMALALLKKDIGQQPVLYAGQYFVQDLPLHAPRWIPTYGAAPRVPGWAAWQFTDGQAQYPGSICGLDTSIVPDLKSMTYSRPGSS